MNRTCSKSHWIKDKNKIIFMNLFGNSSFSTHLLSPMGYKSYDSIATRNYIPPRQDVFLKNAVLHNIIQREREIKFISLFGDRGHRGPYSPFKQCYHNLYIGIIIFPHISHRLKSMTRWAFGKFIIWQYLGQKGFKVCRYRNSAQWNERSFQQGCTGANHTIWGKACH